MTNKQGPAVTPVNVAQITKLNTISLACTDYARPMNLTHLTHIHGQLKY